MASLCLDLTGAIPIPHTLHCSHSLGFPHLSVLSIFLSAFNNHLLPMPSAKVIPALAHALL